MQVYAFIQTMYVLAFGLLQNKRGFKWNWFLPLAGLFFTATLLTVPEIGGAFFPAFFVSQPGDRMQLIATPMLIIFYPLHAFVTIAVAKRTPENLPKLDSAIVMIVVYFAAALAASFIWMVFLALFMMLFFSL